MNAYKMNNRCLSLAFIVLIAGLIGGFGFGVAEVAAGCPEQVVLDTRECEHLWKRMELPSCIGVDAEYELTKHSYDLCEYQIALKNHCSVAYEIAFECDGVNSCPKGVVLAPGELTTVVLGADSYGKNKTSEAEVVMLFTPVEGSREDASDEVKLTGGVFSGSSTGEVNYDIPPGCEDDISGCQVASIMRPVGGFGVVGMLLGVVGIMWRRRRMV